MDHNGGNWRSGHNDEASGYPLNNSRSSFYGYRHLPNEQDLPWQDFDRPWNPEIHPWTEELHRDLNPGGDPRVALPSSSRYPFGLTSGGPIGIPESLHHPSKTGFSDPSTQYPPVGQQPHFPLSVTHSHHPPSGNVSAPIENDSQSSHSHRFNEQAHSLPPVPSHFFASSRSSYHSSVPLPPNSLHYTPLDPSRSAFLRPGSLSSSHSSSMPISCPSNPHHPQRRSLSTSHAQPHVAASVDLAINAPELVSDNSPQHAEQLVREARVWKLVVDHQTVLDRFNEDMKPEEKKQYKKDCERSNAAEKRAVKDYAEWLRTHNLHGSTSFQSYRQLTENGKRLSNGKARRLRDLRLEQQNATLPPPPIHSSVQAVEPLRGKVTEQEERVWEAIRRHAKALSRYGGRREIRNLGSEERRNHKLEVNRTGNAETAARRRYEHWLKETHTAPSAEYEEYLEVSRAPKSRAYHEWHRVHSTLAQ